MFAYDNCMIIENELFIQMYVLYYILLNALNRMLTVYFTLRIDWYINRGQNSSVANNCIDVSLRSVAQRDRIGSVH